MIILRKIYPKSPKSCHSSWNNIRRGLIWLSILCFYYPICLYELFAPMKSEVDIYRGKGPENGWIFLKIRGISKFVSPYIHSFHQILYENVFGVYASFEDDNSSQDLSKKSEKLPFILEQHKKGADLIAYFMFLLSKHAHFLLLWVCLLIVLPHALQAKWTHCFVFAISQLLIVY